MFAEPLHCEESIFCIESRKHSRDKFLISSCSSTFFKTCAFPSMAPKGTCITFSRTLHFSVNVMNDLAVARDREVSPVPDLSNLSALDLPSVFPSPYTMSTIYSLLLAFPLASQATVAFSSLSIFAFSSISANIKPKKVPKNGEDQISVSTGSSLASALTAAWQSFFYVDRPSFLLATKLKNTFKLPRKRTNSGGIDISAARSTPATFCNNPDWLVKQEGSVQSKRVLEFILPTSKQLGVANTDYLGEEGEVEDPVKVQKESNPSIEKVQNIAKHLTAGAISTIVSRTFVAPLERLKLEYIIRGAKHNWIEVIHGIWFAEGLAGFWKGNALNLFRMVPFKSINFLAYDMFCKEILERQGKDEASNFDRLTAGAASGAAATLLCFPLDTVRTRLIAYGGENLGGMLGCFQQMIRREGLGSLYKGLLPALLSMAPSGAVFYGVYDILKAAYLQSPQAQKDLQRRIEVKRESEKDTDAGVIIADEREKNNQLQLELDPIRTLIYGAIAGACAEAVMYPLEVVRRQLQLQQTATKMGLMAAFQGIIKRDGLSALFAGIVPSTIQVLPSASLSFLVYESMKSVMKVS